MMSLAVRDSKAVRMLRLQNLMDDSLPSQSLHFQTCVTIRQTLSQISDFVPDKLPIQREKYLEVPTLFGVHIVIPLESTLECIQ